MRRTSHRRILRTLTLAAAASLLVLAACNRPSKPVARVGDTWIGQDRWAEFLKAANIGPDAAKPQKEQALKSILRRQVAAELAVQKGLDKEALPQDLRDGIEEQTVVYQALQDRIDKQPAFTDDEVKKYYDDKTEQRQLKHVPCLTEAEGKACLAELQAGKPFMEVLRKYCTDKEVLKVDGDLGLRRRNEVPSTFVAAIFEAPDGAILGPFQFPNAWEVVVVVGRGGPAESTFALQRENVVKQMNQERSERVRRELIEESQKKFAVKIRQDALPGALDPNVLPADEGTVVAEVGGETISLADLKRFVQSMARRSNTMPSLLKADLGKYITMMAGEKAVLAMARQQGVAKRQDVRAKIWNIEQDYLASAFSESYLREMPVTAETLKEFFEANRANFVAPNAVTVRIFESSSEETLRKAIDELRGGRGLAEVQKKYGIRPVDGGKAVAFDYQNPPFPLPQQSMRAIGSAPKGAWLGVYPVGNSFRALEVITSQPGKEMTFEEAGDRVREAYIRRNGMPLLQAYLDGEGAASLKVETFDKNL